MKSYTELSGAIPIHDRILASSLSASHKKELIDYIDGVMTALYRCLYEDHTVAYAKGVDANCTGNNDMVTFLERLK